MEHEEEEKKAIFFMGFSGNKRKMKMVQRREGVCLSHLEGGVWIRSEKE